LPLITPRPPPFPYTTLFRSARPAVQVHALEAVLVGEVVAHEERRAPGERRLLQEGLDRRALVRALRPDLDHAVAVLQVIARQLQDRKSTRLNSSHVKISYAV